MIVKTRLFKNIASLGIIQLVNYIFPLITIPYISRIIGPEGYGVINYAIAFTGYFTLLIAYGFDLTATRRIAREIGNNQEINKIVSEVLTARIILFFVSTFFFIISIFFFKPIQKDIYISIILFTGCIATVFSPQYIYQGFQELGIFAKMNFIKGVINTCLIFLVIKKSDDYYWIPILSSSFIITINIFLLFYSIKRFQIKYKLVSIKRALHLIIKEKTIFFSTVVISLYTSTNVVILGFFVSSKEIGYFTTSQNFLNIVTSLISVPISTALYPFIARGFSVSRQHGIELIRKILPIVFYITLFASLSVLFLAPHIIKIVYGNKFVNSIDVLKIISFLPLIIGVSNVFGVQLMLNLGLDKLFFKTTFIASVIGLILNIFMSKHYGYLGTAWNSIIIECFVTIIMYIALKRNKIDVIVLRYFKPKQIILTLKNREK